MKTYRVNLTADIKSNFSIERLKKTLVLAIWDLEKDKNIPDNTTDKLRVIDYIELEIE